MPKVTFITIKGEKIFDVAIGDSILDIAHQYDNELQTIGGYLEGVCGGCLVCSTCHIIVEPEWYDRVNEEIPISDDENDMLDLAFGVTDTSRIGCQIVMSDKLDGLRVRIPFVPLVS